MDKFDGSGSVSVEKWVADLQNTAESVNWSDQMILTCARRLLLGDAKKFINSERGINTFALFKSKIVKEFKIKVNAYDVHQMLQNRRKKPEESCRAYLYDMKEISGQIDDFDVSTLISYVVNGIIDDSKEKLLLLGAKNLDELKEKFEIYEKESKKRPVVGKQNNNFKKVDKTEKVDKKEKLRCYNCGNIGHEAKTCPNVEKGPKCFNCRQYGHISKTCNNKKYENTNQASVGLVENKVMGNRYVKNVNWRNHQVDALIDTGSVVNIMRSDLVKKMYALRLEPTSKTFTGLGAHVVEPLGYFDDQILIDGEYYITRFYVVAERGIPYQLLLGNEYLKQVEVVIRPDGIQIKKSVLTDAGDDCQILHIDLVNECEIIDVPKNFEVEVDNIIKNYKPLRTKICPIETKIILNDETPIYKKLRRLSPLERKVLHEQTQEWLKLGIIVPSYSEFASPVVIVKKKDNSYRVCIDYRELNKRVMKDRFPKGQD